MSHPLAAFIVVHRCWYAVISFMSADKNLKVFFLIPLMIHSSSNSILLSLYESCVYCFSF